MDENNKFIRNLVDPGLPYLGEVTGATVTSIIGYFLLGPPGVVIGATGGKMVTDLFSKAGEEIEKRYLSKRESARIGIVSVYALDKIKTNMEKQCQIRTDGFFSQDPLINRSAADEILEGTLISAKSEYEEKKLKYYGNLVGNIPFNPGIDRHYANYLLRLAERLSYRQICIITLFNRKSDYIFNSIEQKTSNSPDMSKIILFQEIAELKISGLMGSTNNYMIGGGPAGNVTPSTIILTHTGNILHTMLNLEEIEKTEIDSLATLLGGSFVGTIS